VGDRLRVIYEQDGSEHAIEADRVVNGAGRIADLDGLDLPAGQVVSDHGGITLDAQLRSTSNTSVCACGDAVATSPQLSPIATYEGRLVGRNIVDSPKHTPDYASIPACVFTVPALASVGLTQAAADEKGVEFRVEVNDMRDWLSGRTYAETAAWAKVLVDKPTDRIIGAHILGHASEELIHVFALAMKHGITAGDIKELVYGFPTFSADIKSMF
jgi:glutathione reductase (NADPH)